MDWSDELPLKNSTSCSFEPHSIECDEHLCPRGIYSCGDGQCVSWGRRLAFHIFAKKEADCFNKRNLNFMCEVNPSRRAWTLESGLCWTDSPFDDFRYSSWSNEIDSSGRTSSKENCQYLFRCLLSDGFERDCPCNRLNCSSMMIELCTENASRILYPPEGLIDGNAFFYYNPHSLNNIGIVNGVWVGGSRKCRGFHIRVLGYYPGFLTPAVEAGANGNNAICDNKKIPVERDSRSPFQHDAFCWNGSFTFNGRPYAVQPDACPNNGGCISQYRIRDGLKDCLSHEDEPASASNNSCTEPVARHRFQCYNNENKCLILSVLGTGTNECSNNYDELFNGISYSLQKMRCHKEDKEDCQLLKRYIEQSSFTKFKQNMFEDDLVLRNSTTQIRFESYCDSFWDLNDHSDESISLCQDWICPSDQFQCQTGQCIDVEWVCDREWDCPDASDEQAILLNKRGSLHNQRILSLQAQLEKYRGRYANQPFSKLCNTSFEFGCYRARVPNPLDLTLNRPCINLTQIGDGVEDCYNAYDEKNTFGVNVNPPEMWGFHLRCNNQSLRYAFACFTETNGCTEILCPNHRNRTCSGLSDVLCLETNVCAKSARCNHKHDCWHGDDEFWCRNAVIDRITYRIYKQKTSEMTRSFTFGQRYPLEALNITSEQQPVAASIVTREETNTPINYSYVCNRGVAILDSNETRCLCPPAYYGRWCEFFSDRITIIAHVNTSTLFLAKIRQLTLKIKTSFLFNNRTVDFHEFHVLATMKNSTSIKHKFYLLYSRSSQMIEHKRQRYFNSSAVLTDHPYSVHFDVFILEDKDKIRELGSWHYPIYFDYLPAFRLAVVLRFPSWFGNKTSDPCEQNHCNENSMCMPVFNKYPIHYCSCKSGYHGKDCNLYDSRCTSYCSTDALCQPDYDHMRSDRRQLSCICPENRFGPRCSLKYDACYSNLCANGGTCTPIQGQSETSFVCTCSEKFYGKQCENEKAFVHVSVNDTESELSALASTVHFYDIETLSSTLLFQNRKVYRGLPSTINYFRPQLFVPYLGLLKIYNHSEQADYFIMYVLRQRAINITTSPQRCPHVSSLQWRKSETLLRRMIYECEKFLLLDGSNSSVLTVAHYHHICRDDLEMFCFYDKTYLCWCVGDDHRRAQCFLNSESEQSDRCDFCLSGGKCFRGDPKEPDDFICICPPCHQGRLCEFSLKPFVFTLESLLVELPRYVKIIYFTLVCVCFIIGLCTNFCSFITFKRRGPRSVRVGNYLLIVTCLNQMSLLVVLLKFIQITFELSDVFLCKISSYLVSVFTRSIYWLLSWITINRLLIIIFPTSQKVKDIRPVLPICGATFIVVFGLQIHELIYYTTIQSFTTDSSHCVAKFENSDLVLYNRISSLIHYLAPFSIQVIGITLLIVLATRLRAKSAGKQTTFRKILKKQFHTHKELYLTPTIIVMSSLPQLILAFTLGCAEWSNWQRHALLVAYLLSYTPQVLGFIFYVLPSTSYKTEFKKTSCGKLFFK